MTLRLALFGHPVAHSKSPAIHAAFGRATGVALDFQLVDVPDLDLAAALARFRAAGGTGANVTLPLKERALDCCARVTARARAAGAVNALSWQAGAWFGDNTDGAGLARDLAMNRGVVLAGARVLVCGAGGAARGAVGALLEAGAEVAAVNRTVARVAALELAFPALAAGGYDAARGPYDVVVNATSASLVGEAPPLDPTVLHGALCYDMFYADAPTPFMRQAEAAGARAVCDGWGMLVEQAAESFAFWTGIRPETGQLLRDRG